MTSWSSISGGSSLNSRRRKVLLSLKREYLK